MESLYLNGFIENHAFFSDGSYTKDLTVLGVDLAKVAIIDNSPHVYGLVRFNFVHPRFTFPFYFGAFFLASVFGFVVILNCVSFSQYLFIYVYVFQLLS